MGKKSQLSTSLGIASAVCLLAPVLPCFGQTIQSQPPVVPTRTKTARIPLRVVLRTLSRETGMSVVADSISADTPVPIVEGATDAEHLTARLDSVVRSLPKGTRWVRLNLPPSPRADGYRGDDLAEYAALRERIFGVGSAKTTDGAAANTTVIVLGHPVATDKMPAVVDALSLRPVYLLYNPVVFARNRDLPDLSLTPTQQQERADRLAGEFLRMNPQDRVLAFQQLFQLPTQFMNALSKLMTPEQGMEVLRSLGGKVKGNSVEYSVSSPP